MSKQIQSTVAFQDPGTNVLANGRIHLQLSQDAKITANGQVAPQLEPTIQTRQKRQRLILLRKRHARMLKRAAQLTEPLPFDGPVDESEESDLHESSEVEQPIGGD